MKKNYIILLLLIALTLLSITSIIFGILYFKANNSTSIDESHMYMMRELLDEIPSDTLSEDETQGLIKMREEEKLARDVYLTLYDKWDEIIFNNIAKSEQMHTDSVKELLDRYEIEDPVKSDKIGQFTNKELQTLYNELIQKGDKSLVDALEVGATIEDLDIFDLDKLLEKTNNEDIIFVYENLRNGSYNHMKAFTRVLEMNGGQYKPQFITEEEYEKIIDTKNQMGIRFNSAI